MLRHLSIRVKLLILVLAMLIPLVSFRVINISGYYQDKVNSVLDTYQNFAKAISISLSNYFHEIWVLEDIAGTYFIENKHLSSANMNNYLKMIQQKNGGVIRVSWLDKDGNVLASSDERLLNTSLHDRDYFRKVSSGEKDVVSDLIKSTLSPNEYIIPIAKGIRNSNGELEGIVTAVVDVDKLGKKLPALENSETYYTLLDSKGVVVYRSDIKKTPERELSLIKNINVSRALQGQVVPAVREKTELDDDELISVNYPIYGSGWVCKVSSPYFKTMDSYYKQCKNDAVTLLAVILVSSLLAYLLGSNMLRPVSVLRSAAKKIMEGDFTARTNIKEGSNDEIELAAQAFDKMVESIEQWNNTKTRFFTNISHEVKTPLNVIFASVQLIENFNPNLDSESYRLKINRQMKIIRQNCYRIMRLTSNLIDISRYDSGFLKLKLQNYDIVRLVSDITLSVKRFAEAKGITLQFLSAIPSKVLACDPDMMERIILNLISNAVKFTDKNGLITVNLDERDGSIALYVTDTGSGIPQDKLDMIFDRFKQVDSPFSRNQEGSGIGLSLVKALVEAHGGTISVSSIVSKGTTFKVLLPIKQIDDTSLQQLQNSPDSKKESLNTLAGAVSRINIEFSDIYSVYDEIS